MYELPTALEVNNAMREIRSDYRAVLDVIAALNDPDLTQQEKALVSIEIIFTDKIEPSDYREALEKIMWFIGGGETENEQTNKPILVDWGKDFKLIIAPINKIIGCECRSIKYLHWWTFLSAYCEIGDCAFANVVSIRNKKAKGKKLDKWEQEYYRENRNAIDIKPKFSEDEKAALDFFNV